MRKILQQHEEKSLTIQMCKRSQKPFLKWSLDVWGKSTYNIQLHGNTN